MSDLFLSKRELLFSFIKQHGRVSTSDVIRWGLANYHTRADRDARELAEEGRIWRVRDDVKQALSPTSKEEIWSVYEADKPIGSATPALRGG